jgi:hypothetical protein
MPKKASALLLAAIFLAAASIASATTYDLSGKWLVHSTIPGAETIHWDVTQTDGALEATVTYGTSTFSQSGTIDETTGAFSFDNGSSCAPNSTDGSVAADSRTFAATFTFHGAVWVPGYEPHGGHFECGAASYPMNGTRCGNGALDPGEDCDAGECCSSLTCMMIPPGSACSDDGNPCTDDVCNASSMCVHSDNALPCSTGTGCSSGTCSAGSCVASSFVDAGAPCSVDFADHNPCTDDVCDGSGACGHPANTLPCADPYGCGTGTCTGGTCVFDNLLPAGAPCDRDGTACTSDTCNGSGFCSLGPPLQCEPCGVCDAVYGCVGSFDDCDNTAGSGSVDLRAGSGDGNRLKIQMANGLSTADLGDPTYDTAYTLCLFERHAGGPAVPISSTSLHAGDTCGDRACWRPTMHGFQFKDPDLIADGISSFRVDTAKGFKVVGKGAGLPLADPFPDDPVTIIPEIVAETPAGTACWYHEIAPTSQTPERFKGRYDTAP